MTVFELFAKLKLDKSEYEDALDGAEADGQATANRMGEIAGKAGAAIGSIVAAASAAVAGLTVAGVKSAAEYEQVLGGSEAVFGEYADGIKKKAADAYASMGLSANDYLQGAINIGSLLQGSGYGMDESAEKAAEVMQRAADVASIRGMDVSSAMYAIAGAAKGNFTMMDNLGVAINETTLKNYALSKGIRTSYSAMTTAEKVGLAYDLFLEKSSYAAGNYAAENETLAGSFSTLKSAWQNMLAGAGNAGAVAKAAQNAITVTMKKLPEIIPQVIGGFADLVEGLAPELPGIVEELTPVFLDGVFRLIDTLGSSTPYLVNAFAVIMDKLADEIPRFADTIADFSISLISSLMEPATLERLVSAVGKVVLAVLKTVFVDLRPRNIGNKIADWLVNGYSDDEKYITNATTGDRMTLAEYKSPSSTNYTSSVSVDATGMNAYEVATAVARKQEIEYRRRRALS